MSLPEPAPLWHLPRPLLLEQMISGKSLILLYNILFEDGIDEYGAARS
jgi:hypothetical protein